MRCTNCGAENQHRGPACQYCHAPLQQQGYQQGQQGYGQPPPGYYQQQPPPKKSGLGVVAIIVIIVIAVVVLGACGMSAVLYVWVTSLADTSYEEHSVTLRLSFDDGADDLTEDGAAFSTSDMFLKAEQTGGDPIDWSLLVIYCEVKDSGDRKELKVNSINSQPYDPVSNRESKTGQIITFSVWTTGDFSNGDYVVITITKGDDKVYTSSTIRVV